MTRRRVDFSRMAVVTCALAATTAAVLAVTAGWTDEKTAAVGVSDKTPQLLPAVPGGTGLLLEPPLDLSGLTREQFIEMMSTVGKERIARPWTSAVTRLPDHERHNVTGLTHDEVKAYMVQVKQLFNQGKAIPVSDVGLISTQEDIIRQPMLNHVSGFQNDVARVYLLVQRTADGEGWGYYSIVQDMTLDPPLDYFGEVADSGPVFNGRHCYSCHSSGPLAIHPAREDLVIDAQLTAELNKWIAEQPRSKFYFPEHDPAGEYGESLKLSFCADCHSDDGVRGPLHRAHSHPIRVLVDFGQMPPDRRLTSDEVSQLKAWLEKK